MGTGRYEKLLSPVQAGGLTLKNHMVATCCLPHFLQGPEEFPSESILVFVENLAKAGAAIVTIPDRFDNTRSLPLEDVKRAPYWNPENPAVSNVLSEMCEIVHFQGSKITAQLSKIHSVGPDVGVYEHTEKPGPAIMTGLEPSPFPPVHVKPITPEQMELVEQEVADRAAFYQGVGFDGIVLHYSYAYNILGKFLAVATNLREDNYGGNVENRARFPLAVVDKVRERCGRDFYIELQISGDCMPEDELAEFAKLCEGRADVLQIRLMDMDASHETAYNYDGVSELRPVRYAQAIKNSGAKVLVCVNGGFHDPDRNEQLLRDGKCDLIGLARPFICDPQYGTKIREERPQDIVPCLHCNRCHDHVKGLWMSGCRVNPYMGIAHRIPQMTDTESGQKKKVAIIGGGPAGLYAAILAADRGHSVDLYEASDTLGGQLKHSDYPEFKWAVRDYKAYLIRQARKRENIRIFLRTKAEPEDIKVKQYDAVIATCGAEPKIPPIPGVEETKFWTPIEVYGHEKELGRRVVVVGASETGTETALYLAESEHEVTALTRQEYLAKDAWCIHAYSLFKRRWEACYGFTGITQATTTKIENGKVTYEKDGQEHEIPCDSIVLSGGVKGRTEQALRFSGCAEQFFMIGDAGQPGNLQTCCRSALAAVAKL